MAFWLTAAGMSALVALLVLVALLRGRARDDGAAAEPNRELGVYRAQLREIDRDVARGVLGAEDAERLRLEVSRRILDADRAVDQLRQVNPTPRPAVWTAVLALPLMVGGSFLIYDQIGAPGYPDMPLQARIDAAREQRAGRMPQDEAEAEMRVRAGLSAAANGTETAEPGSDAELVERLRTILQTRPDDLQGHRLLAASEAALGNYSAAWQAQQRVLDLLGDEVEADDFVVLADLLILAAGGYVSPEAEAALERALRIDPRNPLARYFSGMMLAQTGRPDLTFQIWRALLDESVPEAPWVPPIRAQIEQIAMRAGVNYSLPPEGTRPAGRGPTAEDIAAAMEMDPEARDTMVRGMIEGLSARLATEGGSAEDWARLITSYGIIGEREDAGAIWAEAQVVFGARPEALDVIRRAAEQAGVAQ